MKFIHTAPLHLLPIIDENKIQMVYANHLSNEKYLNYFIDKNNYEIILNSEGVDDFGNLIALCNKLKANCICMHLNVW